MKFVFKYRVLCFVIGFLTAAILYLCLPSVKNGYHRIIFKRIFGTKETHLEVTQKEVKFLNLINKGGVSVFVIEPRLLIPLLTEEDLEILNERQIPINELSKNTNLTTYGISDTNSSNLNENLIERLKANGYEYEKTDALDARQLHWDDKKNRSVRITGHHFFVKLTHVHHLVVFYKRNTFLWSPAVSSLPLIAEPLLKYENMTFGRYASGYEKFETRTVKVGNHTVQVPSDVKRFIFEIPSSEFMECNYDVAREFYAKHWKDGKPSDSFNKKTINGIEAVKKLVEPFLMPFWISSGTLLGWYRQCDVIPYTTDVDLAGWATDFSDSFEQKAKDEQNNLVLKYVYGIPSEGYQYAFYYSGVRVDFFFTYKENISYHYSGHMPGSHIYFHYIYPKFTLCSAELLGHKVLVPCNSEQVVSAEYGSNWKTPIKSWSYSSSAYNIGPKIRWPRNLVKKTYIEY